MLPAPLLLALALAPADASAPVDASPPPAADVGGASCGTSLQRPPGATSADGVAFEGGPGVCDG
jgi:hypothetical protein